jgi:hypothetical protein
MNRSIVPIVAGTLTLLVLRNQKVHGQSLVGCGAPSPTSAAVTSGVRQLASGLTQSDSVWRGIAKVPLVAASTVALVNSDSLCDAAARAVANLSTPAAPLRAVWVLAAGPNRLIVFGSGRRSEGRALAAVFDSTLTWLADVLLD